MVNRFKGASMDYGKYKRLEFRRKFFRFFGAEIYITDPESNELVGFIEMKAWVLKEDVRIYSDKTKSQELLRIHARSIIDFGVTYDISDSASGEQLFSMRRKGLKSAFLRDQWDVMDPQGQPIGSLQETSSGLALVRRYTDLIPVVGPFIDLAMSFWPITYTVFDKESKKTADLIQQRNPIIVKFTLQQSDESTSFDPRINVALTAMLSVVDASKN